MRPAGEELGSVEPLGDSGKQKLDPKISVFSNAGCEYKPDLLVAKATLKVFFEKSWSILIESGTSDNYFR